jgi:hypothetical protein
MKKLFLLIIISLLFFIESGAQVTPVWIRNMDVNPDTAYLYPEKTITDVNNNIIVLNTYANSGGASVVYKIFVNRYDSTGNLIWNFIFDNNGIGNPRGFDISVDESGNCYIAGGFMINGNIKPLLMKINLNGSMAWIRDSTIAFQSEWYRKIIIRNDLLYMFNGIGVAVFDTTGSEKWSELSNVNQIEVDNEGRLISTGYFPNNKSINRYDINGNPEFADSTIAAERIAVDSYNNIYLLSQWPYELVKIDSDGIVQWDYNLFPPNISFGDPGFEVLTDYSNDIYVIGITDTMYKFRLDGNLIWKKPMNGLDSYKINATITYMNFLAIAGSVEDSLQYNVMVALFDLNGNRYWYGMHNSNNQQEYSAGLAIDYYGIYLLEDSMSNSSLLKFNNPYSSMSLDFNNICVDSVWYEPGNSSLINVRVFNGNMTHINYPVVQIVSPSGDTISNPSGSFSFFTHAGNYYQVYQDMILDTTITDFTEYSFAMTENIFDTTGTIYFCNFLLVDNIKKNQMTYFPNPATVMINIRFESLCRSCSLEMIAMDGKLCRQMKIDGEINVSVNVSDLTKGIYVVRITGKDIIGNFKFIKSN